MLGRVPTPQAAEAMKRAINSASQKQNDGAVAMQLWNDLRWRMKILDGDYTAIQALLDEFAVKAKTEIVTASVRDAVIERLEVMRGRLMDPHAMEAATCAGCGRDIEPGEFRKLREHGQVRALLCALCSATPKPE